QFAGLAIDERAIGVGLGEVRIEADRLVEIGKRFLGASSLTEHGSAHVVGLWIVRIVLHDIGKRGDVRRGRSVDRILRYSDVRYHGRTANGRREEQGAKREPHAGASPAATRKLFDPPRLAGHGSWSPPPANRD